MIAFNNALQGGEIDVDPMYMDEDISYNIADPELYMTQEEQMADEPDAFISTLMENYGRGNPFMQDLSGTYDNYFGETFDMDTGQVGLRDVVGDWETAAADPNWRPTEQIYPDEQFLPLPYKNYLNRQKEPIQESFDYWQDKFDISQAASGDAIDKLKAQGVSDEAIIQIFGPDAFDIWNESNFPIGYPSETSNLDNWELFHLMSNGYTLEEAQAELEKQLG
jgi:hypothetical protein